MSFQHRASEIRRLNTRGGRIVEFTALGFGAAPLGNYLQALTETECDALLDEAWHDGLRYFDVAPFYGLGLSERRVGRLLQSHRGERYTLGTKVGRLLEPCAPSEVNSLFYVDTPQVRWVYDYSYDGVMRSYEASLERLGVDRIDVLYVHDVDAFCHGSREASEASIQQLIERGGWRALTELRANGAVAAIGAGVNEWQPCARLLELVDPDIFLLAGRYTLLEQQPLDTLLPECVKRNVGIVIGGPYNSGVLAGGDTYNYASAPAEVVERVRMLQSVCSQFDVRLNCAALQFVLAHPAVVSVIPGSQNLKEHAQNVAALDRPIPSEFWAELKRRELLHPQAPTPS
jgi:D-threo-aldose 1-dehydrogenase